MTIKTFKRWAVALPSAAALSVAAFGPAHAIDLREAVEAAVASNPQINQAAKNKQAIEFERKQAQGLYLPRVDLELSGGVRKLENPTRRTLGLDDETLQPLEAGLTVQQTLWDSGARRSELERQAARTHWFWSEVWRVRRGFMFVALAAGVINLLAFALPLFTMNVYDRIIPNKSVASLWVLALGVMLAMGLEFTLRLARGQLLDEIGRDLDAKLSQKLFEKVMNIPLLERTGSTGAFARRVSEYELVRDFFASTTVVLAVDMVFMVLFLILIALIAPPLVLVPITGLAIMVTAGLTLQKSMTQVSKDAQADASLQHSVLIESIGGLETLKAARAEGPMLGRWRRYAQTSAGTQEQLRRLTSVAVNMASLAQQGITIGLIVGGFYMFNAGWISMGAIIALVMLAGRALAPVGQFAFLITRARQALVTLETLQTLMEGPDERAQRA